MDLSTGRLYEIGADAQREGVNYLGQFPENVAQELEQLRTEGLRSLTADEQAFIEDARAGKPLAMVSEQVAQKVRLGERELERRARRRQAAKKKRGAPHAEAPAGVASPAQPNQEVHMDTDEGQEPQEAAQEAADQQEQQAEGAQQAADAADDAADGNDE